MHNEEETKDIEEVEELEEELEEKKRGRKIKCTCDEEPDFCEKHNPWG